MYTASLMYDPSKLMGMNIFVLNNNTVYCNINFINIIENTEFLKYLYETNVKTSSW
jgi:hypothetical protein